MLRNEHTYIYIYIHSIRSTIIQYIYIYIYIYIISPEAEPDTRSHKCAWRSAKTGPCLALSKGLPLTVFETKTFRVLTSKNNVWLAGQSVGHTNKTKHYGAAGG